MNIENQIMSSKREKEVVFPNVKIIKDDDLFTFISYYRKLRRGNYYLRLTRVDFHKKSAGYDRNFKDMYDIFLKSIHSNMIDDNEMQESYNWILDQNQEPEIKRIQYI